MALSLPKANPSRSNPEPALGLDPCRKLPWSGALPSHSTPAEGGVYGRGGGGAARASVNPVPEEPEVPEIERKRMAPYVGRDASTRDDVASEETPSEAGCRKTRVRSLRHSPRTRPVG